MYNSKLNAAQMIQRTGRTLMSAGLILLLFVGYQLWGTDVLYSQSQKGLESSLTEQQAVAEDSAVFSDVLTQTTYIKTVSCPEGFELVQVEASAECVNEADVTEVVDVVSTAEVSSSPYDDFSAEQLAEVMDLAYQPGGSAIAQIQAPATGLNSIVVAGTNVSDLRKGPGHYTDTAILCQSGNAAVAGHRTTYGSPFGANGDLVYGDEIYIHTAYGSCTYMVTEKFVVSPQDTYVLDDYGDNRLTLTTCHPKYSSAQRLIIVAQMISNDAIYIPTQAQINQLIESTTTIETVETVEQVEVTKPNRKTTDVQTDIKEQVEVIEQEFPVTCEGASCEESVDLANTIGSGEGWGGGLDGNKDVFPQMIIFSILFLAVWFVAYKVANRWADSKNDNKFKYYGYLAFALPMTITLAVAFYYIDMYLPSY